MEYWFQCVTCKRYFKCEYKYACSNIINQQRKCVCNDCAYHNIRCYNAGNNVKVLSEIEMIALLL